VSTKTPSKKTTKKIVDKATAKVIAEKAGRFAELIEIGTIKAADIRTRATYRSDANPIGKMYTVLTNLLKKKGVENYEGTDFSISDVVVTVETEQMIQDQCRQYLKNKYKGFTKKYIDKQMAWVTLETPATLRLKAGNNKETKQLEKLMGLQRNRVYVVKKDFEKAKAEFSKFKRSVLA
jgi:hypothetical protein